MLWAMISNYSHFPNLLMKFPLYMWCTCARCVRFVRRPTMSGSDTLCRRQGWTRSPFARIGSHAQMRTGPRRVFLGSRRIPHRPHAQMRMGPGREAHVGCTLLLGACRIPSDPASVPMSKGPKAHGAYARSEFHMPRTPRIPSDPVGSRIDPMVKCARGLGEKRMSAASCCSEPVGSRRIPHRIPCPNAHGSDARSGFHMLRTPRIPSDPAPDPACFSRSLM